MRAFFSRIRAAVALRLADAGEGAGLTASLVLLALVGHVVHYLFFCLPQPWYIEDSAISFAFARNLVEGHGLVPFVGAERIEGYSNALWTFLLAAFYAVGVTPWTASKVLGAVFGCLAQVFAFGIARRALPAESKWVAVLAPFLLAGSTQFALWNSSGLENSLFCLLLAAGIYRLVVEVEDDDRRPWSALAFFLLTMTRPDGLAYAGIGLIARLLGSGVRRQWVALGYWLLAFAVPWAVYFLWRFQYFGWEWPLTWYAKKRDFHPADWKALGWTQMRDYMFKYGIVWALPLVGIAVAGFERWRKGLVLTLLVLLAFVVAWDGRLYIPSAIKGTQTAWLGSHWNELRVGTISAVALVLGLASFGQKGWFVRGLLWMTYAFGLFYTILASGDWMKAYRWYSLTSVPQFVLITIGLGTLMDLLPLAERRIRGRVPVRGIYAVIPAIALIGAAIPRTSEFLFKPETSPRDVHKRVDYMTWVQNRLGLDRVSLLDVDMGAHLWWTDWFIRDIAGLIDVPMAQHEYEKPFMKEYIFGEARPMFAHVHGSWKSTMKMESHDEWREQYIEIPGYPSGKRALHVGNHVRKDLIATEVAPADPSRRVNFASGVRLEWWELPAPSVAPGGELYIDTVWRSAEREAGLRVLVFLAKDGQVAWSAEVAPGYDWYRADRWKPWEYVRGGWSVVMPKSLPPGDYQAGLVVLDQQVGVVLPFTGLGDNGEKLWGDEPVEGIAPADLPGDAPEAVPDAPAPVPDAPAPVSDGPVARSDAPSSAGSAVAAAPGTTPPLFMIGEYVFPDVVHIVSGEAARAEAQRVYDAGLASAAAGDCETAKAKWKNARRHVALDKRWAEARAQAAYDGIVGCLVGRAGKETDDQVAARIVAEARFIDPANPLLDAVAEPLGARLDSEGRKAAGVQDWAAAYTAFHASLLADPSRSFTRRLAEDVRDRRLKIRAYDPKKGTKDPATAALPTGIPFWDPSPLREK